MDCSHEEGLSLLRKWLKESTPLYCSLWPLAETKYPSPWRLTGDCWIFEANDKLVLGFSGEAAFEVQLCELGLMKFETPADAMNAGGLDLTMYAAWLSIELPAGLILILAEKAKPN